MFIALLRIIFLFSVYFVIAAIGMSRPMVLGKDFVLCICMYVCKYGTAVREIGKLTLCWEDNCGSDLTQTEMHTYICMFVCKHVIAYVRINLI